MTIKRFWHRITDRDRLAYSMVIAFGICLLGITLFFQFGYMIGEKQLIPNPIVRNEAQRLELDEERSKLLLLDEPSPMVRVRELLGKYSFLIVGMWDMDKEVFV